VKYHRVPTRVIAEPLASDWGWLTAKGERMTARTGDYRVTDPATGAQWSIAKAALRDSYVPIGNGVYESCGVVEARRIEAGQAAERVVSTEGTEEARPGDWILQSESGARWVVGETWFGAHYSPVPPEGATEKPRS
jgi:hypothetical protein